MCLASLCSEVQKTFCFFTSQSQQGCIVLALRHRKLTLIPKCGFLLFSDHNGNLKMYNALLGISREKCFKKKTLCNCVVFSSLRQNVLTWYSRAEDDLDLCDLLQFIFPGNCCVQAQGSGSVCCLISTYIYSIHTQYITQEKMSHFPYILCSSC